MTDLKALIEQAPAWSRKLEQAIFGTDSPSEVARRIQAFVADNLGEPQEGIFYSVGVGIVVGARLADGSSFVLKVHRHNVSVPRLQAVIRVQRHLADDGLPAPRPLLEPAELDDGIVTAEAYQPAHTADGHRADVRASIAGELSRLICSAAAVDDVEDIGRASAVLPVDDDLWGEPHDLRFDFAGTASGAEWIDDLGRSAKARLLTPAADVTGHLDWRVENLGFSGTNVAAIYDFDSLSRAPEAVIVGQAAGGFSTDWRTGPASMPSVLEMAAFVHDYESARGARFSSDEKDLIDAANLYLCAYGARCQHSDTVRFGLSSSQPDGWLRLLQERGESGLLDEL